MPHGNQTSPRKIYDAIGKAMDWDKEHGVFGSSGTASIPWLHKEPKTFREMAQALYEYMRAAGMTVHIDYDPEAVDVQVMVLARDVRKRALDGQ